jgi:nucleotide-binding universal stress UspA family protein
MPLDTYLLFGGGMTAAVTKRRNLMFDSILVPLDGSRVAASALPYATVLAETCGARLTLLSVLVPQWKDLGTGDVFGVTSDVRREADARSTAIATDYLGNIAAPLRARGIACDVAIARGNPAEEIIAAAGVSAGTLIVMSTHGYTGFKRLRLGSVAQHVLRHAAVPTLIVRPPEGASLRERATIQEVTVTLDGSPLAEVAVPVAAHMADAFGVPLVLLSILENRVSPTITCDAQSVPSTIVWGAAEQADAEQYLAQVAARIASPARTVQTVWRRGVGGRTDEAISDYLRERPAGIVVMASHGRGGVLRWMLGSIAEGLVTHAPAPVLIVRATTAPPLNKVTHGQAAQHTG